MPKEGKLSDLGLKPSVLKNPFTATIRRKADEWRLSDNEKDGFIEFCETAMWNRDKTNGTKNIIADVCQKYNITDERFGEIFHLAFPFIKKGNTD